MIFRNKGNLQKLDLAFERIYGYMLAFLLHMWYNESIILLEGVFDYGFFS